MGEAREVITRQEFGRGILSAVPDIATLLKNLPAALTLKSTDRNSIGKILQRHAKNQPDAPFLRFEGKSLSYGDVNTQVNRVARVLEHHGVKHGSVVGIMAANHPDTIITILAAVKLGAIAGMINTNQRGRVLEHSISMLDSTIVVVGDGFDAIVKETVCVNESIVSMSKVMTCAAHETDTSNPEVTDSLVANNAAFYIFTSGTTGLPKASVMTHHRWLKAMAAVGGLGIRLRRSDTLYCSLPLYHNNGLSISLSAVMSTGACLAIGKAFSASRFWEECILNRATAAIYIGEVCRYLLNQPVKSTDRQHSVRMMVGNGMRPDIWDEFVKRFGVKRVAEFFAASECNVAFVNAFNLRQTAGFCPLPYQVVKYELDGSPARNSQGRLESVKVGEVGLLLGKISNRSPFDGYTDNNETRKKIIFDGFKDGDQWFNSGDLVRSQGFRHIAFVDRLGDTFRWKGENVATTQVEEALFCIDGVEHAVVYGVEIPGTDGRAGMAAVKLTEDANFDATALGKSLREKLPKYAMPLVIRIVDSVEQTATFKSRKVELRSEGLSPEVTDPMYVYVGGDDGYVPFYDGYVADVAASRVPDETAVPHSALQADTTPKNGAKKGSAA